jgi:hypothetical protein
MVRSSVAKVPNREKPLRKRKLVESWVVYKMTLWGKTPGANAVCEQAEWDEMQLARPGHHTLIREGVTSEAAAEKLARESPGGTAAKQASLRGQSLKR